MKKFRVLTAALCAAVLVCSAALPTYAASESWQSVEVTDKKPVQTGQPTPTPTAKPSTQPTPAVTGKPVGTITSTTTTPTTTIAPVGTTKPAVTTAPAETGKPDATPADPDKETTGGADWDGLTPVNPLTPDGQGTVLDSATDTEGKKFFTITTADGDVFYLVIDRQKSGENVYFLNTVTVSDLLSLAESKGEALTTPTITPAQPEPEPVVSPEPDPDPEPEPEKKSNGNMGTLLLTLAVIAIGGAAGWYFKIYRPKQQQAADLEEDDYTPELEPEFEDEYGDASLWNDDGSSEEGE